MNREIVVGERFTSILGTEDDIYQVERNYRSDNNIKSAVPFKPIYRKRTIKTTDFFKGLRSNFTNHNEILPTGCKYFHTFNNGRKLLVVEEQPRIRTIKVEVSQEATIEKLRITGKLKEYGYENYLEENKNKSYHSFQLSFPYVVFIILLNKQNSLVQMQPFFRLHPITSLSDYLFLAPLYNIPSGQTICLGSVRNFESVIETTENIIETFWLNRYNKDYTDNITAYEKSDAFEVHDYLSWMYFTKINPMFIYNVNWIKYDMNLSKLINNVKEYSDSETNSASYSFLQNVVSGVTSDKIDLNPRNRNTTYSLAIGGTTIEVGDEINFDNELYFLYSITTDDGGESYNCVELENQEGELISVPYMDFVRGIGNLFKKVEMKEAEVNGKIIKPDDIITYKVGTYPIHKRIKSIRTAQDGKVEALIGSDHYLIENIDFEVMDLSNVKLNGEHLDKEKYYYLVSSSDRYNITYKTRKMRFSRINIGSSGNIVIRFIPAEKHSRNNGISINHAKYEAGDEEYDFIEPSQFISPDVICHFDKLLFNENEKGKERLKIVKGKGLFVDGSNNIRHYRNSEFDVKELLNKFLLANETRLFIPNVSCDIDFKVGDPIIYANWEQPEDMFLISSIDKFEYDENAGQIFVHSTSLNKKVKFKIPYINTKKWDINIGLIRKVESQCGEWKSGDRIKATSTGIPNFPKKDTNSIIAFINDGSTKYPIALCSNLCTLWMNEDTISKFKRLPFKTTEWSKNEPTPVDVDKIKWQHGDMFKRTSTDNIKFLARKYGTKYAFEYHYATNWCSIEWGSSISKNRLDGFIRYGILMPRITTSNPRQAANSKGFPNYLGGYLLDAKSRIYLRSEQFKEDF